jgi:hypothetical protein
MNALRFTLVADGPTDAVLLHPLKWLLISNGIVKPVEGVWADLRQLPIPPDSLANKIAKAIDLYPCDLLFIHRDAEREPRVNRINEIQRAVKVASSDLFTNRPYVCVIPVRMTESWLLFDEVPIRRASGNPEGRNHLDIPSLNRIEEISDPKVTLHNLLRQATELPARRLRNFSPEKASYRLAELIDDFSPLRRLPAFGALERDLRELIQTAGWRNASQ